MYAVVRNVEEYGAGGEVVILTPDRAIADAVHAQETYTDVIEPPVVTDMAEVVRVPWYRSSGRRNTRGLWSVTHYEGASWSWDTTDPPCRVVEGPIQNDESVEWSATSVVVLGTDSQSVTARFSELTLLAETRFRPHAHRIRTKVEELDPIERF